MERTQSQEIWIARTCADQKHRFGVARDSALTRAACIDRSDELRLHLRRASRQGRLGNRTRDDVLPKAARRERARHGREAPAVAADQLGKLADARGQQGLDQFAQTPRQNRGGPAGADRDNDLAAIDDSGKN